MSETDTRQKVKDTVQEIRPMLQADGGDIEFVDFTDDGTVKVRLQGACAGCPGARMTLQMVVQAKLQKEIPEVKSIEAVE
jgi:Fe-S cluster biogenesis protein NfuA